MKGDFSRNTFDRTKHYNQVLMQQGRVQVDADWNEQQAIHQNRIETEAQDVIGKCGAPEHSPGFAITTSGQDFTIGPGRYYVEGILCENEAEVFYSTQPDFPKPSQIAELLAEKGTTFGVIYLDVWQQHLTALDDPEIREVALGGPDTATRLKTVWQVKVLPVSANSGVPICNDSFPEWDKLVTPSTGTLIAQVTAVNTPNSPCIIPPNAGYQRLENQLYRVEIHKGTDPNDTNVLPTFKWSRDNGSVVTEIKTVSGNQITVADLGPDQASGFTSGQWVEVLDDASEKAGVPGQLFLIQEVLETEESIIIVNSTSIPTDQELADIIDLKFNPKLRRWDQTQETGTNNGIEVSTTEAIDLEAGIQIQFSSGTYKTGDYWLIPARTATGEIEWPMTGSSTDNTPAQPIAQLPLGVTHHYCRLAIVQQILSPAQPIEDAISIEDGRGNTDDTAINERDLFEILQDCRILFPPLTQLNTTSCCSVVVSPGESIQAAIDSLPPTGGCICLKAGVHPIKETIRLEKSNVSLKGESSGTKIKRSDNVRQLTIFAPEGQKIENITIEKIQFEIFMEPASGLQNSSPESIVYIANGLNISIQNCSFISEIKQISEVETVSMAAVSAPIFAQVIGQASGILVKQSNQVKLTDNSFKSLWFGIQLFESDGCLIEYSYFSNVLKGMSAVNLKQIKISGNKLENKVSVENTLVKNKRILPDFINLLTEREDSLHDIDILKIISSAIDSVWVENPIISDNEIKGFFIGVLVNMPLIAETATDTQRFNQVDGSQIFNNDLTNLSFGVIAKTRLKSNQLASLPSLPSANLTIAHNHIENISLIGIWGDIYWGTANLANNYIAHCGYIPRIKDSLEIEFPPNSAISFSLRLGHLSIESCRIVNTGLSRTGQVLLAEDTENTNSSHVRGINCTAYSCEIRNNSVFYTLPVKIESFQTGKEINHRALSIKTPEKTLNFSDVSDSTELLISSHLLVTNNSFKGIGQPYLIEVNNYQPSSDEQDTDQRAPNPETPFHLTNFSHNQCFHQGIADDATITVSLLGQRIVAMGNQVLTTSKQGDPISLDLNNPEYLSIIGNVCSGTIVNGVPPLTVAKINDLNVTRA